MQPLCSWHVEPSSLWWPQLSLWSPREWSASCRMYISHHLFALFIILQVWLCWKEDLHFFPYIYSEEDAPVHLRKCAIVGKFCSHIEGPTFVFLHLIPFSKANYAQGSWSSFQFIFIAKLSVISLRRGFLHVIVPVKLSHTLTENTE